MDAKVAIYKIVQIIDTIPMGVTGLGGRTATAKGALRYQHDMIEIMKELRMLCNSLPDMDKKEVVEEVARIETLAKAIKKRALSVDQNEPK
jgi:hypothetical protein